MGKKLKRVNTGQYTPTASAASSAIVHTPPRVSPSRVKLVCTALTVAGFAAIAADAWMSWEGFNTLPIDWWTAATLTTIVAAAQLGSGIIQALGGDPFTGVGGSASGDQMWGMTLRGLYGLDIFSNFAGFGGPQYLSLNALLSNPGGTIGLALWNAVLAILLAFGDEILFRLCDRIAIGAKKNAQLAKIQDINLKAHNTVLSEYQQWAMQQAQAAGQRLNVSFDWLEGNDNV